MCAAIQREAAEPCWGIVVEDNTAATVPPLSSFPSSSPTSFPTITPTSTVTVPPTSEVVEDEPTQEEELQEVDDNATPTGDGDNGDDEEDTSNYCTPCGDDTSMATSFS
mmetsp:Transcript_41886/g.47304  ORF Transcript_41886/g.47304 Transcript_41886/m.47304 type:complete len:109 (-) Transcript_41886:78-404(-)